MCKLTLFGVINSQYLLTSAQPGGIFPFARGLNLTVLLIILRIIYSSSKLYLEQDSPMTINIFSAYLNGRALLDFFEALES